ncbi:MAG: hypothetical protein HN366_19400 [Deltaproteobacteria bacterium]|jgi:hypothetical protein|nr:hypothetical protein [Deltaproteobacteria bacterium]
MTGNRLEIFDIDELIPNLEFVYSVIQLVSSAALTGEFENLALNSLGTLLSNTENRMDDVMDMLNSDNSIELQRLWNTAHPNLAEIDPLTGE